MSGCILALQWFNWPVKKKFQCYALPYDELMNCRRRRETSQRIRRYEHAAQLYVPRTSLLLPRRPHGARRVISAKSDVTPYKLVVVFSHWESVPRSTSRRTRADATRCHTQSSATRVPRDLWNGYSDALCHTIRSRGEIGRDGSWRLPYILLWNGVYHTAFVFCSDVLPCCRTGTQHSCWGGK